MADRVYHRTAAADAIMRDGFRDATGTYMTNKEHSGVWVTFGAPWDEATGGLPEATRLLVIDAPVAELAKYEWVQEGIGYHEALVPAAVLNRYRVWEAWECDGCGAIDEVGAQGWTRETTRPFAVTITTCAACPESR